MSTNTSQKPSRRSQLKYMLPWLQLPNWKRPLHHAKKASSSVPSPSKEKEEVAGICGKDVFRSLILHKWEQVDETDRY
jgi:hypothetical protein